MATDLTTDRPTESAEDFAKRFAALAKRWKKETLHHSRMDKVAAHPAHREIIAMGEKALPLIFADLEKTLSPWFMALREITGTCPVPKEDAGDVDKMAAAWLAWGRAHGYRCEHVV
jgi:hypothetical protein